MEILLDDGEKSLVDYLSKGRYDRARKKNAKTYDLNKTNNRYFMDRIGLFAELALAKITNTYPNQVISPVCKTKLIGLSSAVAVCFNKSPLSALCVKVIS